LLNALVELNGTKSKTERSFENVNVSLPFFLIGKRTRVESSN